MTLLYWVAAIYIGSTLLLIWEIKFLSHFSETLSDVADTHPSGTEAICWVPIINTFFALAMLPQFIKKKIALFKVSSVLKRVKKKHNPDSEEAKQISDILDTIDDIDKT